MRRRASRTAREFRQLARDLRGALSGSGVRVLEIHRYPIEPCLRIELELRVGRAIEVTIVDTSTGRAALVEWAGKVAANPDRVRRYSFSRAAHEALRAAGDAAGWDRLVRKWGDAA